MPHPRIREIREDRELTQAQVAKALGVHESTVSRWEAGRNIPDWRKAQLAEYLGVSVPHLMGWRDDNGDDGDGEERAA